MLRRYFLTKQHGQAPRSRCCGHSSMNLAELRALIAAQGLKVSTGVGARSRCRTLVDMRSDIRQALAVRQANLQALPAAAVAQSMVIPAAAVAKACRHPVVIPAAAVAKPVVIPAAAVAKPVVIPAAAVAVVAPQGLDTMKLAELRALIAAQGLKVSTGVGGRSCRTLVDMRSDIRQALAVGQTVAAA
eukprot:TRINITY_DN1066_c0_g1_i3.p1 TRINITY_DN1066_c0_g1~~TRINITY_DN1066_c0_g1_i3.p1  ORF type:complete len:188 (+),score=47.54 TRINITY_DN1066_c0_g1_i3:112-675(+)